MLKQPNFSKMFMKTLVILLFSFVFIVKDIFCAPKIDINKCVDSDCEPRSEPAVIDVPPNKIKKKVHCSKGEIMIQNRCYIKV